MIDLSKWCKVFFIVFIVTGVIAMWTGFMQYGIMLWILAVATMIIGFNIEILNRLDLIEKKISMEGLK